MKIKGRLYLSVAAIALAGFLAGAPVPLSAQQTPPAAVAIDNDDIGGVVTGANGPEAGVWVIAETRDLPTRYAKMVVTDDQGRYVVPDLPKAKYKVWARGYGLVDSPKIDAEPGQTVNHRAVPAASAAEAAKGYPAIYWYSMMKVPTADQFGGKDKDIPNNVTQPLWLNNMRNNGCVGCHQLGQLSTRTFPQGLGEFSSHAEAWIKRTQSGQAGRLMVNILAGQLGGAPIKYFADWTQRVEKGELPTHKPTRPEGVERNVVVTTWDWANEKQYLHDLIASDRRYPTVNAYGPVVGNPEYSMDKLPILDPKTHKVVDFPAPVKDPSMPPMLGPGHAADMKAARSVALLGQRGDLGQQGQQPQRHVRQGRPRVAGRGGPRLAQSGLLHKPGVESVRQAVPAEGDASRSLDPRSENAEIHLRGHMLHHAPCAVRL